MSFNYEENLAFVQSPAMTIGLGKIPMDGSFHHEAVNEYYPVTGTVGLACGAGTVSGYNGQEVRFEIHPPTSTRILFNKSYLKVTGFAADAATGRTTPVGEDVTIPWNTIAALLETAEVQYNDTGIQTEKINQNLGDASMVKMLTTYTSDVLENASDRFFTPCIEDSREVNTDLFSDQATARSEIHLCPPSGRAVITTSKNIMLPDLFESMRIPAGFLLSNLRIIIRPKDIDKILIQNPYYALPPTPTTTTTTKPKIYSTTTTPRYYITEMRLYLCLATLTGDEAKAETIKISEHKPIIRQSFYIYDAQQKQYVAGANFRDAGIKNMQAAVMMFKSTDATDGLGINPYQYCFGCTTGLTGFLNSLFMKYEGNNSPNQPIRITSPVSGENTQLFEQYRMLCSRLLDRDLAPPLNFVNAMSSLGLRASVAADMSPYALFCCSFYPHTQAFGHKVMGGSDHEIICGAGDASAAIIVRIRLGFVEINGDTTVYNLT